MNQTDEVFDFKDAFCAHFRCPPEDFERKALFRLLYPHAIPVAWFLLFFNSTAMHLALEAVETLGNATEISDVNAALDDYRYQIRAHSVPEILVFLRIRLSGRRALELFSELRSDIAIAVKTDPQ